MCCRFVPCSGLLSLVSSSKLPLAKFGHKQDRRSSFCLNPVLKAAFNDNFLLEDKPVWFILHFEDGI